MINILVWCFKCLEIQIWKMISNYDVILFLRNGYWMDYSIQVQHLKHYLQSLLLVSYFHISQGTTFPFLCQFFFNFLHFTTLPMFHLHNQSNLLFQVLHCLNYNFQLLKIIPKRVRKETANGLNGNHWEHVVQIVGMDLGK